MTPRHSGTVGIAFEMLLEAIDKEIRAVMENGLCAFQTHDFQQAADSSQRADRLKKFRERVKAMSQEWEALSRGTPPRSSETPAAVTRGETSGRLPKGVRTPEEAYYVPILITLDQMGGKGATATVLERVYDLIKPRLNAADYEPLPRNPRETRWRNTAKWARKKLVQSGLLNPNSPVGIWEITEQGRAYLRQHASSDSSDNDS